MEVDDLADDKRVAVGTELDHLVELALQMDWHLGDARGLDLHGRDLRQPGLIEFAFVLRKSVGGIHHRLPHWRSDDINAELSRRADIPQRMLLAAVRVARNRKRDHGRHDAHDGEEGKRREIADAGSANG